MEQGLTPIELRDIDAGIQVKSSDLAIEGEFQRFPMTTTMKNWSFGKRKGLTTRYGIMPFPGHNSADLSAETTITKGMLNSYKPFNLISAEGSRAASALTVNSFRLTFDMYEKRNAVFGAYVFSQPVQPLSNDEEYPVLYWQTQRTRTKTGFSDKYQLDICPSSVWRTVCSDGQEIVSQYEATVGGGTATLPYIYGTFPGGRANLEDSSAGFCGNIARLGSLDLFDLRTLNTKKWYINSTEHKYTFGYSIQYLKVNLNSIYPDTPPSSTPDDVVFLNYGMPKLQNNNTAIKTRFYKSTGIGYDGPVIYSSKIKFTKINESEKEALLYSTSLWCANSLRHLSSNSAEAYLMKSASGKLYLNDADITWKSLEGTGSRPSETTGYIELQEYTSSSNVQILAQVYGGKPIISYKQNIVADKTEVIPSSTFSFTNTASGSTYPSYYSNDYISWVDARKNPFEFNQQTVNDISDPTPADPAYTEDLTPVITGWRSAPNFLSSAKTSSIVIDNGGVSGISGFLEANKIYEYSYSILNKITGVETNVAKPAKAKMGTVNGCLRIYDKMFPEINAAATGSNADTPPLNFFSFILYYREIGSFEWLNSGEVPANATSGIGVYYYIGQADAVGLPGGQPGGYVDNSPLSDDTYLDVVSFQGKLWWLSKEAVRFSSANPFVYPVRNYVAASSGEFRGLKVHFFPGQAEAQGRLVIFGSKGMYDVRQTNNFQQTQIQVSASSEPLSVPIPDSNIIISERSNHTAFSGRTAVVAEGFLYFWGPTGIFRDDGVSLPVRVSDSIEPDLFDSFDNTRTDEFFAHYNKKSQEILFFYRPKDTSSGTILTKAWVYSLRVEDFRNGMYGAWTQYTYGCLIDWAQDIDLTKFYGAKIGETVETPRGAGLRTLIGARAADNSTVSRPYFHDDLCDCGDMTPGTEMMVKSVSRINATTVRLTFVSDYNTSILNGASVGGTVYVFASQEYGKLSVSLDGLREIKAKGSGYIDILDSSAYTGPDTLSTRSFFPVYFSNHAVPCVIDTNFFAPYGTSVWSRFRYSHLLIQPTAKYSGTVAPSSVVSWNCNHTLSTPVTKTITTNALNTRERTTQIVFDMQSPGMQSEGQGVQLNVSYNQQGPRWTLFAWTLWTAPTQGRRNLLNYQQ